jgi:predicted phage tail component-like protein
MSFTFNGINSDAYLKVLKVGHSVLPSSKITSVDVANRAGSYFVRKTFGIRSITIDVVIVGTDQTDLRSKVRSIADWLDVDSPQTLSLSEDPNISYVAILDGDTNIDQILSIGTGQLKFTCLDPFAYGQLKTVSLVAGSNTVTYNGTADAYPTMTVTFSASESSFEVSNQDGQKVHIDATLGTNTTLVIDFNIGNITINGTGNLQTMSLDSDFFPLKKGINTLTVSAGASVSMTYKERFK